MIDEPSRRSLDNNNTHAWHINNQLRNLYIILHLENQNQFHHDGQTLERGYMLQSSFFIDDGHPQDFRILVGTLYPLSLDYARFEQGNHWLRLSVATRTLTFNPLHVVKTLKENDNHLQIRDQ